MSECVFLFAAAALRKWLRRRSAPAGLTCDAGKISHKWQPASNFPIQWPHTHSRHKFPYESRESKQGAQWFVISGSLVAPLLSSVPQSWRKSDESVWLWLNGFGSSRRRCFGFLGFDSTSKPVTERPPTLHTRSYNYILFKYKFV